MRQFWRYLLIVLVVATTLQGCTHCARLNVEVQSAKRTFNSGDFKKAFRQLLPLAADCVPDAQYAVGYMYYYGYGINRDTVSGLFWIKRAAQQGYLPAIKALQVIEQSKKQPVDPPPVHKSPKYASNEALYESLKDPEIAEKIAVVQKENQTAEPVHLAVKKQLNEGPDEVLLSLQATNKYEMQKPSKPKQTEVIALRKSGDSYLAASLKKVLGDNIKTLANSKEKQPSNITELVKTIESSESKKIIPPEEMTKLSQAQRPADNANKAKYTLQVFGSYSLDSVKELQTRLSLKNSTYCGMTKLNGRDWYVLTYGKYSAPYQAKLAMDELPKGIKALKPWTRKTDDVQWLA